MVVGELELLDTLDELGTGCIAFSVLAQGLLSKKYAVASTERATCRPPAWRELSAHLFSAINAATLTSFHNKCIRCKNTTIRLDKFTANCFFCNY